MKFATTIAIGGLCILFCSNNTINAQKVPKKCLFEILTSTYCPPCDTFALWYNSWEQSIPANDSDEKLVSIKYHIKEFAPVAFRDSFFNNDALKRGGYYKQSFTPGVYLNGSLSSTDSSSIMQHYTECVANIMTDYKITGSYIIDNDSLYYNINVESNVNTSDPFTVFIAATEEELYQFSILGSRDFTNIMRKMLPDGDGIAITNGFTANTPINFKGSYKYQKGIIVPRSNVFNKSPFDGHLIVFVQNDISKEVVQSEAFSPQLPALIKNVTDLSYASIYPNPASNISSILFDLKTPTVLSLEITDIMGRTVRKKDPELFNAGRNRIEVDLENLSSGMYIVSLSSTKGQHNMPLIIAK